MRRALRLLFLTTLVVGVTPAWGQGYLTPGADEYFRVEWEATRGPRGRVVTGYVYNTANYAADNVRVLVEALDASGNVIGTATGYVIGTIQIGSRRLFQVSIPGEAASYRVRVITWDWVGRGAG